MKKLILFSVLVVGAMLLQAQSINVHQICGQNGQVVKVIPPVAVQAVDLGLSVKWANMNVGATTPEGQGNLYAWGETATKADYYWNTYFDTNDGGSTFTKYKNIGGKTVLDPEDDAAHVNWHGSWRMPTKAEWQELIDNCTWTRTKLNGITGYKVTSNRAGYTDKFIFLPCGGATTYERGHAYWSSSLNEDYSDCAWHLYLGFDDINFNYFYGLYPYCTRYKGLYVRPVLLTSYSTIANDTIRIYSNGCDNYQTFIGSPGSQLTMTASSDQWSHFVRWQDGNTDNPRTIITNGNAYYTAYFETYKYSVQVKSDDAARGSAYISKVVKESTIDYHESVGTFEAGSEVFLAYQANYGYHFAQWSDGNTSQQRSFILTQDTTFTAIFAKNVYSITKNATHGYISGNSSAEYLDFVTLTVSPDYGYHFTQWSDGVKDNPRIFQITKDTAFTAEFAKAQYAITTAVNDESRGTTTGDNIVDYLSSVTLTATAEYGYHFDHWENNGKTYSANPLTVTATGNASYTAYFIPNIYSVVAYSDNTSWGTVSAPSSADYLDYITLTAESVDGARFVQWSDGNKDNPRTIQVTEDVTLSAEFAVLTSGRVYGDVFWSFKNNTLFIEGMGYVNPNQCQDSWVLLIPQIEKIVIDEQISSISVSAISNLYNLSSVVWNVITYTAPSSASEAPFYGVRNQIYSFEFGKQVKKIPAYLCYGMTGLTSLTIGSNVTNIGKNAFDGCEDIESITCEAITPPNCGSDAFAGISIFIPVYVPVNSVDMYAAAPVWRDFYTFSSIQAEEKTVTNVTATPSDNSVVMAWPAAEEADVYTLVIERNGVTFCVLSFNAQGQLIGIQFAPGRDGSHNATYATQTATGWQFTVTSLQAGTKYDYTVTAKKESSETPVYEQSGSFTTTGTETAIDQVTNDQSQTANKIIKDGHIFILRGEKVYTLQGQEVK